MDGSADLPRCSDCGEPLDARGCPRCRPQPDGIELKVLQGELAKAAAEPHADVRLVRQVKMPTVERLTGEGEALKRLPGQVDAMEEAVDTGDLEATNRLMDEAMGSLLRGPGYTRQPIRWRLAVVLWTVCGILVLSALAFWLL